MKILKYILLLLFLSFITLTIFIATQKADFDIVRTKIIKTPKATLFNYINDYKNWEEFGAWKQDDPNMTFLYPAVTSGVGASYSWEGKEGSGTVKTIYVKDNDSIHQKMDDSNTISEVYWTFKDTLGKTKVTWRTKGKMSFGTKIFSTFMGGIDQIMGSIYERSLANIDRKLDYEINTFSIVVNGETSKSIGFYMKKTINSKNSDVSNNIQIMIPNLIRFFDKNKIASNGKPFVVYNSADLNNEIVNFSVGLPLKEEIFTSSESEITSGSIPPFQAVKVTLVGDYSHEKQALQKAKDYLNQHQLFPEKNNYYYVFYIKNKLDTKNPSKWITEFFIPIKSKSTVSKPVLEPNDTEKNSPTDEVVPAP